MCHLHSDNLYVSKFIVLVIAYTSTSWDIIPISVLQFWILVDSTSCISAIQDSSWLCVQIGALCVQILGFIRKLQCFHHLFLPGLQNQTVFTHRKYWIYFDSSSVNVQTNMQNKKADHCFYTKKNWFAHFENYIL